MARLSKKNEELLKAVQKQAERAQGEASLQQAGSDLAANAGVGAGVGADLNNDSAVGLGVDLIEIERMERAIERTPRILERVFTSGEREYAWSKAKPAIHYAAFFAGREAVLKALGCGFSGVNYSDVEITHNSNGKPEVLLHGNALVLAQQQGITDIQISLSHTHQMAVASAVAIKAQSSPRKVESTDPMQELARQFKELRTLLDDLGAGGILKETQQEEQRTDEPQQNKAQSEEPQQDILQPEESWTDEPQQHEPQSEEQETE